METGKKPKGMKCKLGERVRCKYHASINISICKAFRNLINKVRPLMVMVRIETILKYYDGNPIQQYGTRVILGKWNNQYWRIVFHDLEAQGPILIELSKMIKMGLFTRHW